MNPLIEQLGWVLVHSLWQFSLVVLFAAVTVRAMRRTSSALRYGVLVTAMAVSVSAPVVTWMLQRNDATPDRSASDAAAALGYESNVVSSQGADTALLANDPVLDNDDEIKFSAMSFATAEAQPAVLPQTGTIVQPVPSWSEQVKSVLQPWLAWIVAGWSLGVLLCSARPLLGWHTLRRLKRVGVSPVSDEVLAALHCASERLGLRGSVQLLQSTLAQVPIVVGYFRPVILLPISLITSIPAAQLEAILTHELAHIQRHDFIVNLLQTLVETLFFYHPSVWWLSRQIRVEREHCCDDLVVKLLGNRVEYGRALVAIEQLRGRNSVLALGANDGSLLSRVRRIVGFNSTGNVPSAVERWPAALLGLVLIAATFLLTLNWNLLHAEHKTEVKVSVESLPVEPAAKIPADNAAVAATDDDETWPPRDSAALLKRLQERDAEFNNRSIHLERRWVQHVDPLAVTAGEQQKLYKVGDPKLTPPVEDEIPEPYDQPHRVPFRMTVKFFDRVAFDNAADLETMMHPRYEEAVAAKQWPGLPTIIAYEQTLLEHRIWMEQEYRIKRKSFEWTCGFGYASLIDTIDSMRVENKRLVIKGKPTNFLHYWSTKEERDRIGPVQDRFEIELDRDWVVRRAVFEIAAEPVRHTHSPLLEIVYRRDFGKEIKRFRRFVVETSGTSLQPNSPAVASEGRYLVTVEDANNFVSTFQDEKSKLLQISEKLTEAELEKRLAPDREPLPIAGLTNAENGPVKQDANPDDTQEAGDTKPALRITGRVVDVETGKVIDKIRMVPASVYGDEVKNITWQSQYLQDFTDGRFLYETDRPWDKTRLRIEAEGYRPAITRVIDKGEVVELEIKLERKILAGIVQLPNGRPAAKAQVTLATWTNEIKVEAGKLSYGHHGEKLRKVVETDEHGRFELPAEIDPSVAVVAHEAGYAEVANAEASLIPNLLPSAEVPVKPPFETRIIKLQPCGRVEGRVLMGDKPVVGAKYWVYQSRADDVHVQAGKGVETDAEGRFVVEQLPPGKYGTCQRNASSKDGKGNLSIDGLIVRFDVPSGGTTTLALGSPGRTVIGELALPEGFPHKIDWAKVKLNVSLQTQLWNRWGDPGEDFEVWSKFLQTDEGKLYGRKNVSIAADGSFRIEGLPAAEYDLSVSANGSAVVGDPKPASQILSGLKKIVVPGVVPPDANTPIDLGTIELKSLVALPKPAAAAPASEQAAAAEVPEPIVWGPTINGLRARVVPVLSSMSEDAIDLTQRVTSFETLDDVGFAVEIENVADKPVSLRELRYGTNYGESKGKLASDWFGQFLFSIDYFDAAGNRSERPEWIRAGKEVETADGALVSTLEPKQTVKMLLRPNRWLSVLSQQPMIDKQRAVVKYRGAVADKEVEIVTPAVQFTVQKRGYRPSGAPAAHPFGDDPKNDPELESDITKQLVWGEPVNGLRAALDVVPESRLQAFSHGTKPKLKLLVQNVSDKPVTLASLMWLSELPVKANRFVDSRGSLREPAPNEDGVIDNKALDRGAIHDDEVEIRSTWYTGITPVVRVLLKPQQVVTFDAGNLGLAVTKERAEKFEHVAHRRLVAPSGKYTLQATERFGTSFQLKDADGKVTVPSDGDIKAELTTGPAKLDVSNEVIECEIVDAVTGKPVEGTTVSFMVVRPKTATSDETAVAHLAWGPKSPSKIYFTIPEVPEDIAQRADRDELEVRFGVGGHPDYEDFSPAERIPLKQFFHEGSTAAREVLSKIKLTPKKKVATAADEKLKWTELGPQNYAAFLSNGLTFELEAIAFAKVNSPDGSKRKAEGWWRPDGTKLDAAPAGVKPLTVTPFSNHANFRELVFRVQPQSAELIPLVAKRGMLVQPWNAQGMVTDGWNADGVLQFQIVKSFHDESPGQTSLYLSELPLVKAAVVDLVGKLVPAPSADARTKSLLQHIRLVGIEKSATETVLKFKPHVRAERVQVEVTAVLLNGQTVRAVDSVDHERRVIPRPAKEIGSFELRLRPMTHGVTFVGFSMLPGQKSDMKTTVVPLEECVDISFALNGELLGMIGDVATVELEKMLKQLQHDLNSETGSITIHTGNRASYEASDRLLTKLKAAGWKWPRLGIRPQTVECDIVDAVTSKPVDGATVNFRFLKPKSGDKPAETVADIFWGPQAPSHIYFSIPDEVMARPDREEIEVQWSVAQHDDYEPLAPQDRLKLKPFLQGDSKSVVDALSTIKLTPKKKAAESSPPKSLEFLKPYPKLHGLSLDMTEPQFVEIIKQQELKTRKTVKDEKITHHIALGDDHTLIAMFDKDAKCSGIQRVRGDLGPPLNRHVSLKFNSSPLVEVLEKACEAAGLQLSLDGKAIKSEGYTKNIPVTIDVERIPLRDALTQILKPFNKLSFTLDKDQIFISTRQQVEAREKANAQADATPN